MASLIARFLKDDRGATSLEYGLIAALISIAVLAAVQSLSAPIKGMYSRTATVLDGAGK
ncbi:Flp family type IVb pilin [Caulobacter hibisci]|uniref:Flp family type IVb pilin n=1 Tax=Caulobacter hibisci TaxID=2035993 RepID=A0ABS0T2X3_9CAUL|nr:Flp family type IVb pilin [Caulobacter hibisci]MBI1686009.1 Flp family type IVb pilin [Caulobacter hibisci]